MQEQERLGPYSLIERLGRGGFAEVWRARPLPQTMGELPRHERLPFLRVLAGALRPRHKHRAALVDNLLASLEMVTPEQATRRVPEAPPELIDAHWALSDSLVTWLDELAASGELDLALKVPFHDGYVRQLRREKDLLKRIQHPNLVTQLALAVTHDPPYLAMELVDGWSLREALKTEALPPMAKILAVMDQLLGVLGHLHRRGLVHGDVKPENILMQQDGALKLIDLGLGRVSQAVMRDAYLSLSLASRVPIMGTLSYMAPEVRRGEPAGPPADLYAAGIVLYEMLVGDVPSGMALPSEAAAERGLSQRFDVLLKWMLHPEPHKRIATAEEFRERVLLTLNPRQRHQLGTGRKGVPRAGTQAFDQWALTEASPFIQGDWVGDYQLEEPLGRGGFGEVWRARPGEGREGDVALKIALGSQGKDALEKEAEVSERLDHPLIPTVRALHLDHDPPYLVVDFVRGGSLRARLNEEGPLEPAEVLPLARSLVDALAHCHARGVVHRDLKPENLLLDRQAETLTLLDFGLASLGDGAAPQPRRAHLSDTLRSQELDEGGTFEYLAPERRRGEPGGPAADVYALGVILFEMLSCELPRGLTKLRELRPAVPASLEALCSRLLAPDPARRPTLEEAGRLLAQEKAPRAFLGRRRQGKQQAAAGFPRVEAAGLAAALPLLGVGLAGPLAGVSGTTALLLCGLAGVIALGLALRIATDPRASLARQLGLLLVAALGLFGAAGRGLSLLPQRTQDASLQALAGLEHEVEALAPDAPTALLDEQVSVLTAQLQAELSPRLHAARLSRSERRAAVVALRVNALHLERLSAWSAARHRADQVGSRAAWQLTKARLTRPGDPEAPPAIWGAERLQEQERWEGIEAGFREALDADPLNPELGTWRRQWVETQLRAAAWRRAVLAEGERRTRAAYQAARAEDALELLLTLQRLFPASEALAPLLAEHPGSLPANWGELAARQGGFFLRHGRLEDAEAVAARLPEAEATQLRADVAAARERARQARSLWTRAQQLAPVDALPLLNEAAQALPHEKRLARQRLIAEHLVEERALAGPLRAATVDLLWTEIPQPEELEARLSLRLEAGTVSRLVRRLAAVASALRGDEQRLRRLLGSLQDPELETALVAHVQRVRARWACEGEAGDRETAWRTQDAESPPADLAEAYARLREARLAEERSGLALRARVTE